MKDRLSPAALEQLPLVRDLLEAAGLPTDGFEEQFPTAYVVVERDGTVIGVAGLELHGAVGLLRSVAVAERSRGEGVGRLLVEDRLQAAKKSGLEQVFLLTTTAADYFRKLGFTEAPRAEAPSALAASAEFARACPASATCLVYRATRR